MLYSSKSFAKTEFWSKDIKNLSKNFWIPTPNKLGKEKNINTNSWFHATKQKRKNSKNENIVIDNSLFLKEESNPFIKAKTIKLFPKTFSKKNKVFNQKSSFEQWFKVGRIYYNNTIKFLNQRYRKFFKKAKKYKWILTDKDRKEWSTLSDSKKKKIQKRNKKNMNKLKIILKELQLSWYDLRTIMYDNLNKKYKFALDSPADIRYNAIKDAFISFRNGIKTVCKKRRNVDFTLKSNNDKNNSLFIPRKSIKNNTFYSTYLGNFIKSSQKFDLSDGDSRLCYKKYKGYYLMIMDKKLNIDEKMKKDFISLDPGVRTFLTGYASDGIYQYGINDNKRFNKMNKHLDELRKRINECKDRRRSQRLLKAYQRSYYRLQNIVTEVHWKVSNHLCKNFKTIFIPTFNTQDMATKKNKKNPRKINKTTTRNLLTWSHYKFRQRLIHQANKYGCNLYIVNEAYTSKTCTCCGWLNNNLNGSKVFKCQECELKIDRDINGSRNILLRQLK